MTNPVIIWFRRDLRLADNPALHAAVTSGKPVIALYIDETDAARPLGSASRWWLHHSLERLCADMSELGGRLVILKGLTAEVLDDIIKESGADHVVWNRRYCADGIARDKAIKSNLTERGLKVESFKANLLVEPWELQTKTGGYYKVFTPFWKTARAQLDIAPALQPPTSLSAFETGEILALSDLNLLPTRPDWGSKMRPYWEPGEAGARHNLQAFLKGPIENYDDDRNRPDKIGTSRLSAHLAFGEISPRQIWHETQRYMAGADKGLTHQKDKFISEIGWREFSYTLLFYNPDLAKTNFRVNFNAFPWDTDEVALERWQRGQTGYPFVDAGMRELWATGWQHNRVRMVTASFLIKHLMLDWRAGESWFWDTLLDADPASNAASWQWVAGSGADASPYFRIFNPFGQGKKFDPEGDYVRRWCPELKHLPNKFIHQPWEASALVLKEAGVELGKTYPHPIVNHKQARARALDAYKSTKA